MKNTNSIDDDKFDKLNTADQDTILCQYLRQMRLVFKEDLLDDVSVAKMYENIMSDNHYRKKKTDS